MIAKVDNPYAGSTDPHIDQLRLTVRATNALRTAGYVYLSDILKLDPTRIRQLPNIGKKTAAEIIALIEAATHDVSAHGLASEFDPPIEKLNLTVRAANALRQHGCRRLSDVLSLNEVEVNKIRNIGLKTSEEIMDLIFSESARGEPLISSIQPVDDDLRSNPVSTDLAANPDNIDLMRRVQLGLCISREQGSHYGYRCIPLA